MCVRVVCVLALPVVTALWHDVSPACLLTVRLALGTPEPSQSQAGSHGPCEAQRV